MDLKTEKTTEESPKVISLFGRRNPGADTVVSDSADASPMTASGEKESEFLQEMRRNMENAERQRKERLKANQGVLKSYRIKN